MINAWTLVNAYLNSHNNGVINVLFNMYFWEAIPNYWIRWRTFDVSFPQLNPAGHNPRFFSYEICKLYLGSLIMWYCIEKPYQIYPLTYHLRVLKSSTQKRGFDEVLGHRPWEYHYIAQLEIDKILLPLTSMEKRSSNSNYCSVVDQSGKGKPIWLTYWRYDFSCSVWCPLTSILVYSCDGCFNQLLMLDQVERLNLGTADARKKSENGVGQTRRPAWNPRIWPCLVSFSYIVVSTIYIYIHMLISILPGPTMITVVDEYFLDGSKHFQWF